MLGVDAPPRTSPLLRILLGCGVALVTLWQVIVPGVNHDVRYVVGATGATAGFGLSWAETWAHRPLMARLITTGLADLSPGVFWVREIGLRAWSVLLAATAAWLLWRGLSQVLDARIAGWVGLATGAALAWAPGWDFAEPEWYATALAVAAIGLGLRRGAGPWLAGVLLAAVVLVKFTTAATALVALAVLIALPAERESSTPRDRWITGLVAGAMTPLLFGLTVVIESREWQWLLDMPALNPEFRITAVPALTEGLVNSLVVAPITIVAVVAAGWLASAGGATARRTALLALGCLAVLAVPFVVQQQNFLYHLTAVPVGAAALVAGVAAGSPRLPVALPWTGVLALSAGVGLFGLEPRTRDQYWWVATGAVGLVLVTGLLLAALRPTRPATSVLVALACLAPLLVTVSPRTAYSFSLAHHRTTAASNLDQARTGPERRAAAHRRVPPDTPVVYLSFAEPYWLGNPTPCRYASPTFLQRAGPAVADEVARTRSYAENLACLSDPAADAVVIETGWFNLDRVRPEVRAAVEDNFDCARAWLDAGGLMVCPRR